MLPGKMCFLHDFSKKHVNFDIVDPEKLGFDLFFHLEPWKMVMLSGKLGSQRDELGFMGENSGGLTRFQHEYKS